MIKVKDIIIDTNQNTLYDIKIDKLLSQEEKLMFVSLIYNYGEILKSVEPNRKQRVLIVFVETLNQWFFISSTVFENIENTFNSVLIVPLAEENVKSELEHLDELMDINKKKERTYKISYNADFVKEQEEYMDLLKSKTEIV